MQLQPGRDSALGLRWRALLLMATTVVLLIVGLLGMHAMDGSAAGHSSTGSVHLGSDTAPLSGALHADTAVAQGEHRHAAGTAISAVADDSHKHVQCGDSCVAAPVSPEHTAVACVLALLSALLILVPPGDLSRTRTLTEALRPAVELLSTRIGPRPPSLILLSISRT